MRQTTLSVAFDVKPESFERLGALLDDFHKRADAGAKDAPYADFLSGVPVLHFLSLSLFPGADHDPLFVLEANFDGEAGPFWGQLEAAVGRDLRECLRCCKAPRDEKAALFAAATGEGAKAPLAPYLEACALTPSAFHHGNRGLTRARIESEHALFLDVRKEIAGRDGDYRKLAAPQIHQGLRKALIEKFVWLRDPAPPRVGTLESVGDMVKLALFAFAVVFTLSIPGLVLGLALPDNRHFLLIGIVFVLLAWRLSEIRDAPPAPPGASRYKSTTVALAVAGVALFFAAYWVFASAVGAPLSHVLTGRDWPEAWTDMLRWIKTSLPSVPVTAIGALVWVRTLERRDSSQDAPPVDPHFLSEMARREDRIPQNHMGSVVSIKPGVLRMIVIRAGHLALFLILRVIARDGYLGSMRTIHFAHWAFVNNKSRLIFFSNFDQTWESYLDDFIEKAHGGLSLAWSCGVGFPPTRFLIFEGASRGRQFKEWARHSMAVSHFWYSAYKDLTTEQIERNYRIALGLRKPNLDATEAATWLNDL